MARTQMDLGSYDGMSVNLIIDDDSVPAGTNTVPGTLSLHNENPYPVTELEGQFNCKLNIMPSTFNFKKIDTGNSKTIHFLVNVPESAEAGSYEIKIDFDFKIDTPPSTTRALTINVTKAVD